MEDSKENNQNMNEDNDLEETNETYCPYKKVANLFSGMFGGNKSKEQIAQDSATISTKLSTEDTELGLNEQKKEKEKEKPKCPFGFTSSSTKKKGRCPFGFDSGDINTSNNYNLKNQINENINTDSKKEDAKNEELDSDSGDEVPKGGCPVMGATRREPENKNFDNYYEIPCFGNYDFMFFLRGSLTQKEWIEKTEKMRKYPRHLKYTLFYQGEEKLQKVHEAEFPRIFFIYDDIKQKGIRLYKRKKYREALEHFNYAYGLLKWIQFKDKKRQKDFVVKPSLDGILDDDIEEKHVYLDEPKAEEESYLACVIYLLEIMAYCHIELRHYTAALECLDECVDMAKDLVPDVYFRRAQARMYNKDSKPEDLELAKADICKAIVLGEAHNKEIREKYDESSPIWRQLIDMKIYYEHKEKVEKTIQARIDNKVGCLRRLLGKNYKTNSNTTKSAEQAYLDERTEFLESFIFCREEDIDRQYKILKEMKSKYNLAVKFFTETKNNEQLELTYKEFEAFHETFEQFKFFYKFKLETIDPKIISQLTEEEKKMFEDEETKAKIAKKKLQICETIFSNGNFNIELYRFALDKVFGDEREKMEEQRKREEALKPKVSFYQKIMNLTKGNFVVYLSAVFILLTIGAFAFQYFNYSSKPIGGFAK